MGNLKSFPMPRHDELELGVETVTTETQWDDTFDVVVCGSGAAGAVAALSAVFHGAERVLLVEKDAAKFGGTTAKSGGCFWVPGNHLLKAGLDGQALPDDDREACLRYMARLSYPDRYERDAERLGLSELEYGWLTSYYDDLAEAVEELDRRGVIDATPMRFLPDGAGMLDYTHAEDNPFSHTLHGRSLGCGSPTALVTTMRVLRTVFATLEGPIRLAAMAAPSLKETLLLKEFGLDITYGLGVVLAGKLKSACEAHGVEIRMGSPATKLLLSPGDGAVVGVACNEYARDDPRTVRIKAASVVFGTGGFSHNPVLRAQCRVPVLGTGASGGCTGDLHRICTEMGVPLRSMEKVWGCNYMLEENLASFETESCIFQMRGDSFFVANREGKRTLNEKDHYDLRARGFCGDDTLMFYVCDARNVDFYGSSFSPTLPVSPHDARFVRAESVAALGAAIDERLAAIYATAADDPASPMHGVKLGDGSDFCVGPAFSANLADTLERFNAAARAGKDAAFGRGATPHEQQWHVTHNPSSPNCCLEPLDVSSGGVYCVILCPGTIDTKGGPAIDLDARVLRADGTPVAGLYAAGNASAAPVTGDSYWTGGCTLGAAMLTGWKAGRHAAGRRAASE